MATEEVDVALVDIGGQCLHRVAEIAEAAALGFGDPFLTVTVAVKDDAAVVGEGFLQQLLQCRLEIFGLFQNIGELAQLLGHHGVQHRCGAGDRLAGAHHAELELITGKGDGGGTVAVSGVLRDLRKGIHADLQLALGDLHVFLTADDRLENSRQLIAEEHGQHSRGGFVTAETAIVAGIGHAAAQHVLIFIHALNKRGEEQQELCVLTGGIAGLEEILTTVGAQRPVIMLTAAVDTLKGLFVEQAHEIVARCHGLEHLHRQLIVIAGDVGIAVDRCNLVLRGGSLIVLGLGKHA